MKEQDKNSIFNIWGQPLILAAALMFLYWNVLQKLVSDWWTDENYSHGLLVPFVIGYIVWIEQAGLKKYAGKPALIAGSILILTALTMLAGGVLGAELFVQRISLVVIIAGIIIYFYGTAILKKLIVPFLLLIFAIPIPQIIFNKIAIPLQFLASQIAVWAIRAAEIPALRKGNVIEILPKGAEQIVALEVVEACSGVRSMMTLVTLALVLWYFTREKQKTDIIRAVILMFSAIPIAVLTNAGRVAGTGILTYHYGSQSAESFTHSFSGWLVYIVALVLLAAVNVFLKKIFSRKRAETAGAEFANTESRRPIDSKRFYSLVGALILAGITINWFHGRGEAEVSRQSLKDLPGVLGEWKQSGDDIRFGEQTESILRTSDYIMRNYTNSNGKTANLYIGYYASQRTGATYHSPLNCLPGAGWEMKSPELVRITTPAGKSFTANRYIIVNGQYKEVMIYWYQGRGRAVPSEYADKVFTVLDSVLRRRSDGAMIRVMTGAGNDEKAALEAAVNLSGQTADVISSFVPE